MRSTPLALFGFVLLSAPLAATAQFSYTTNNGTITITGYTGPGGAVTIPATIAGLPVTAMGDYVFLSSASLTSITIPSSVTHIGKYAFEGCRSLTSLTIPGSVSSVGYGAFAGCGSLPAITVDTANCVYSSVDGVFFNKSQTSLLAYPGGRAGSYAVPGSVTYIGYYAFYGCTGLTNITIPGSVTYIADYAFSFCTSLQCLFFTGNGPNFAATAFDGADNFVVYYLPGTTGWDPTSFDPPARLWNPLMQSSSVGPVGFGFNITGTTNIPIVVEATTNLANEAWVSLQSLNLTNGAFYFSDPNWTNYPARFYRVRSP